MDINDMAYKFGKMARGGMDSLNHAVDVGSQKLKDTIDQRIDADANARMVSEGEMLDRMAQSRGEYGAGRCVIIDYADGSRSYRPIHDRQRSDSAVTIVSKITWGLLETHEDKITIVDVPITPTVHVILGIDGLEPDINGVPLTQTVDKYDDRGRITGRVLAIIHSAHVQMPINAAKPVPYNSRDAEWPWNPMDETKWVHMATDLR